MVSKVITSFKSLEIQHSIMAPLVDGKVEFLGLITVCVAAILALVWWQGIFDSRLRSLPGPKGNWLTGIGISLPYRSQNVLRKWALEYGELFQIRVGWYNWVVINSPEAMKAIYDKQVSRHSRR